MGTELFGAMESTQSLAGSCVAFAVASTITILGGR